MSYSVTLGYGTRTAYPNTTCINSVASNAACTIGGVDSTATSPANPVGFKVDIVVKLASTGVTSTGVLTVYLIESADGGTTWSDGLATSSTSIASTAIKGATPILVTPANANSQTVQVVFDMPSTFTPKNHTLLLLNGSGAALSGTGHSVSYTPITYTIG